MFKGNEFELHGIISTSDLSDREFFEKFSQILNENGLAFCGRYYQLDKEGKYTSDLTFFDLYSYIQTAERDSVGMHNIEGMAPYTLHIYSNKMQVNLCKNGDPIADFVFSCEPAEFSKVKLIRVNESMVADYEHAIEIEANECIDQEETWYFNNFGSNGIAIRDALIGILNPVKAKQIIQTQKNLDRANKALSGE